MDVAVIGDDAVTAAVIALLFAATCVEGFVNPVIAILHDVPADNVAVPAVNVIL